MKVELLDKSKKKKILNLLEENYGISELKYLFIKSGKDKIRVFSGSLSKEEINDLAKNTNIELIGARLCNLTGDGIRINFDIINLPEIKSQITENIQVLDDEKVIEWMKGNDLHIDPKKMKQNSL